MKQRDVSTLSELSAAVLAEANQAERVKTAQVEAVRAATPTHLTELGTLMHKVAEELRSAPPEVTYEDLDLFFKGEL